MSTAVASKTQASAATTTTAAYGLPTNLKLPSSANLVDNVENYAKIQKTLKFPHYAPFLDSTFKEEPYGEFEVTERGLQASEDLKHLFRHGLKAAEEAQSLDTSDQLVKFGYAVEHVTPAFGTEIHGIQISQLDDIGKNDLARLVAERGVVIFRNQDFRELPIEKAKEWAEYFGRLHVHQTDPAPKGHPDIHIVYRDDENEDEELRRNYGFINKIRVSSVFWHSDITFEKQPAGITWLGALEVPNAGGDTLFVDTEEVYRRLSPEFRKRLHGLKAVHTGIPQVTFSKAQGGIVRREPVENEHPVIRTHPVTGRNSVFVNSTFTKNIVGYKKEESDFLLNFLYDTIAKTQDAQLRVKWKDGSVVFWDNRRTGHSALHDWHDTQKRHLFRYTPIGEVPFGPELE